MKMMMLGVAVVVGVTGTMLRPLPSDPEAARLRRHFAVVLDELRARDVSSLTPRQRAARAEHIDRLAAYAARGVYPRNTDFAGRHVPYFIDRVGTRCAMAYLIEESGSGDYVASVARRMNNAYIDDIARDTQLGDPLAAWLATNGLSQSEAARIQPSYDGGGCCVIDPPREEPPPSVATGYKVGTGAVVLAGMTSLLFSVTSAERNAPRPTAGWVGVGTGVMGLTLGAVALLEGKEYATLGLLNLGVGAVATVAGIQSMRFKRSSNAGVGERKVALAPVMSGNGRRGLLLSVLF